MKNQWKFWWWNSIGDRTLLKFAFKFEQYRQSIVREIEVRQTSMENLQLKIKKCWWVIRLIFKSEILSASERVLSSFAFHSFELWNWKFARNLLNARHVWFRNRLRIFNSSKFLSVFVSFTTRSFQLRAYRWSLHTRTWLNAWELLIRRLFRPIIRLRNSGKLVITTDLLKIALLWSWRNPQLIHRNLAQIAPDLAHQLRRCRRNAWKRSMWLNCVEGIGEISGH